jgi:hypothetical protein
MDEQEFTKRVLPYVLDNLYRDAEVERVMGAAGFSPAAG